VANHTISGERSDIRDAVLDLFVGECLGTGWSRHVYALKGDDTKVIKVEHSHKFFSNIMEWKVWEAVRDTPAAAWFAPCHYVSHDGLALVQARTVPLTKEQFAELVELPDFLSDTFFANFGYLDGRVVCHDFGRHNFFKIAAAASKMVPPNTYSPSNGG
jgi:hypothetical protein